jgi:hypothetical protein
MAFAATAAPALPATATAHARFEQRLDHELTGLAVAGRSVLAGEIRGEDAVLLRIPAAGGRARVLERRPPAFPEQRASFSALSGSSAGYAYVFGSTGGAATGTSHRDPFAARFGGPPRPLGNCFTASTDVDGTAAVSASCGVRLLDLDADAPPELLAPEPATEPRIAGRMVSWYEPRGDEQGTIVVYDRDTGAAVYRVEVTGDMHGYDLDDGGALVVALDRSTGTREATRLYTADAAHPVLRDVGLRARARYAVRQAGRRIVFLRWRAGAAFRGEIGMLRPGGRARIVDRRARIAPFDFDGRRLAWVSDRGRQGTLVVTRP